MKIEIHEPIHASITFICLLIYITINKLNQGKNGVTVTVTSFLGIASAIKVNCNILRYQVSV